MLKDVVVVALFVLAFATWVTVHVALCWRLAVRARPRWRAVAALGLPPLAPIYVKSLATADGAGASDDGSPNDAPAADGEPAVLAS